MSTKNLAFFSDHFSHEMNSENLFIIINRFYTIAVTPFIKQVLLARLPLIQERIGQSYSPKQSGMVY
jgi:hypothetical protein